MRERLSALLTAMALMSAVAGFMAAPASGQTPVDQPFTAYGSGTVIALNALGVGNTIVANVQAAHSGGSVNSEGLGAPITDELGQNVQPALSGENAYGRGAGVEVGLLTGDIQNVDENQLILAQLAEASAPPPSPLVVENIPIDLTPLLRATTAQGEAQAIFDPNTCTVGRPLSYGRGFVENLELVGEVGQALIASNRADDAVSSSRTVTYLVPNGDGTFGVVSETRLHVAPISLFQNPLLGPSLSIEVAGDFTFRAIATGKPGGARIEYPGTPVLTIRGPAGVVVAQLTLQDLLGQNGLVVDVPTIATLTLGSPPHQIGAAPNTAPQVSDDGTFAAASVDAIRLSLLQGLGLNVADLRVGHMEARVSVPAGGLRCNLPVDKIGTPNPVQVEQDFTITIRIPSDEALFEQLFGCDLIGIRVTDVHEIESGNPDFVLTGASNGGVISADGTTVTWDNLGDYRIGDPPLNLIITGRIPGSSGPGVLRDTATVTASLGNCEGGTTGGQDIVGSAVSGGNVTGVFTLRGPEVSGGHLAATGGDERLLLLGGVFVLGALAVRRRLRRPAAPTA